jgi:hypothetical protein
MTEYDEDIVPESGVLIADLEGEAGVKAAGPLLVGEGDILFIDPFGRGTGYPWKEEGEQEEYWKVFQLSVRFLQKYKGL